MKDEHLVQNYINQVIGSQETPGIQYAVVSADSVLFMNASGLADVVTNRPMTVNTTQMIYSMTKPFTAVAVWQLIAEGKIGLDEPVGKILEDFPYGNKVTVRHLLSQTSGVPNPIPLKWVHLAKDHASFDESAVFSSILQVHPDLDFTPGDKYAYSNISYWILGKIIEKVSGEPYTDVIRKNVFRKLNLADSSVGFTIPSRDNHSKGYISKWSLINLFKFLVVDEQFIGEYEGNWLLVNDHYLNGPSFGGMVCSIRPVMAFLQDQLADQSVLFPNEIRLLFYEQQQTNSGDWISMTPGWHIGNGNAGRYFFKEGGGGGFHSEMRLYPDQGLASVVIANNTTFDVKRFLNKADNFFLNGN